MSRINAAVGYLVLYTKKELTIGSENVEEKLTNCLMCLQNVNTNNFYF